MYEYLAKRYALALYEVAATKKKVDEYIDDLKQIETLIKGNDDLKIIINNPEVSTSKKIKIFKAIFEEKTEKDIVAFLLILVEKHRIVDLHDVVVQMDNIRLEAKNEVIAVVKTVVPLNDNERASLIDKLKAKYNKLIILKESIDASILGGVYLRIGDDIIDGTVKYKIDEIKKLMLVRG